MSNVDCEGQGSKQEGAMIQTKEDGGLDELDVFTFLICFDDRTKSISGGLNMAVRESKESRMAPRVWPPWVVELPLSEMGVTLGGEEQVSDAEVGCGCSSRIYSCGV